jgi:outer membrane usher protein
MRAARPAWRRAFAALLMLAALAGAPARADLLGEPVPAVREAAPPDAAARPDTGPQATADAPQVPAPAAEPVPAPAPEATPGAQPVLFGVRVNGEEQGTVRLLQTPDGRLFARRADLERWRLVAPSAQVLRAFDEDHLPLDAFTGAEVRVDAPAQSLELQLPARFFDATTLSAANAPIAPPEPVSPGGFLSYDLFYDGTAGSRGFAGLLEAGAFGAMGVLTSSVLIQGDRTIRLETTLTRDFPESLQTLRLGDTFGASGLWGRSVRFGGLRFGTNFGTAPTLATLPIPALSGEAVLPSVTDLYVDGVLRQTSNVPAGPFRIDGVPVLTGQGEVRVVVRDLLGREQVITLPYYASSQLLRAGLSDHSFEVGRIRNAYGLRGDDYGRLAAVYQHRRGLSDTFTGELRMEVLPDQRTLGVGGSAVIGGLGVASAAAALSAGPDGQGHLVQAGFERQSMRGPSVAMRAQWASPAFTQLGQPQGEPAAARRLAFSAGVPTGFGGSLTAGYASTIARDRPPVEVATLGFGTILGRTTALLLNVARSFGETGSTTVSLTLVAGLGDRTSGSANVTRQDGQTWSQMQLQRNLQGGEDTGYRLLLGDGASGRRMEAGVIHQTAIGSVSAEAASLGGSTYVRAGASGAVTFLGGRPFLARRVGEGFGVVHVPDFPGVGVYVNNRLVSRTDAQGYAILPELLPYQANPVRIETADLPIDTTIDSTQLQAVPYYRSGVMLRFPVRRSAGALIRLVLDDGGPMPLGAQVQIGGAGEAFPVAYDGEVYVTGLSARNRLVATWAGQRCEVEVEPGERLGSLPRIGPLTCPGVRR